MSTDGWRIELFGSLRMLRGNQILCTFPPSKTGDLLAFLACHAESVHTRQELSERFWPEADSATGRTRLRQHLAALRRQLEPDDVSAGSLLCTNRDEIGLVRASFTTDIADFESALRCAANAADAKERARCLTCALAFYQGELLPGYHEHWIQAERERLKQNVIGVLCELASACEQANDLSRALDYARRLVAADPLREESHLLLMRLLVTMQQPASARRQYKTLERLLKAKLDETPSLECLAFLESLASDETLSSLANPSSCLLAPNASYTVALAESPPSDASEPLSEPGPTDPPALSETPLITASDPAHLRRSRLLLLAGFGLLLLVAFGLIRLHQLETVRDSPAHRNFSPAAKDGKQDEFWSDRYETKPGDKDSQPTDMVVDKNGNIYVIGIIDTLKTDVDWLILKYTPDGTLLWENRYNGTGNDIDRPGCLTVDAAGDVYVTGESYGKTGSDAEDLSQLDIMTIKFDGANGRKIWEDRYDGPGQRRDGAAKIALDNAGHVNVFGNIWDGDPKAGRAGTVFIRLQYAVNGKGDGTNRPLAILRYDDPLQSKTGSGTILLIV